MRRVEPRELAGLFERQIEEVEAAEEVVEPVIRDVREEGDDAVARYTEEFDSEEVERLRVTSEEVESAYGEVDRELLIEMETAAENVRTFHAEQLPEDLSLSEYLPGVQLGHLTTPLDAVGCYVPGGRAPYPSTALMCAIPAAVAGVGRIVLCSPPEIPPETLVAADLAGADEVYRVGGAQAVAAMAYGTESVDPVDKIVGPGGIYVTAAKSLVRGDVEIDLLAGPSEILVLADSTASAEEVALDMAAQAEHGPDSLSALITTEPGLIDGVEVALRELVGRSSREEVLQRSLDRSAAVEVESLEEGIELANEAAPEHLEIVVEDELPALSRVRHAGAVFLGRYSPVAAGDYATGANHVLPTAGLAGRVGGLDTLHFLKRATVQRLDRDGLELLSPTVEELAGAEDLDMHVRSVKERLGR